MSFRQRDCLWPNRESTRKGKERKNKMVKLESVMGGNVQFHFNAMETLHKIVVMPGGDDIIYKEKEVLAMLQTWNKAGASLTSDQMAVDLINGLMKSVEEDGQVYVVYTDGDKELKCNIDTMEITEE